MARRPHTIGPTAEDPTFGPKHVLELVRSTVPPVHRAGLPFVSAGLALAVTGRRHRWIRRAGLLAAGA
ncbi:phosphatidylserine decarboxylase family protein, partial [Mycobacterium palustre]|nr:phosphatidylserine decarboxylase family protein [Mycobacterium palustre]